MTIRTVRSAMGLRDAYELGLLARGVHMPPGESALTLYDTTLVEDDGPGSRPASTGWPSTWETVGGGTLARKILHVERPQARRATLVVCAVPSPGEDQGLVVSVNGHELQCEAPGKGVDQHNWQTVEFPSAWLRKGRNTILLSCPGPGGWWLSIASKKDIVANAPDRRQTAGTRSQRSIDWGRSWQTGLGPDGAVRGEYMVRLNLDQSAAEGELVGPVIDLAAEACGGAGLVGPVKVQSLQVAATKRAAKGATVELAVRTGSSPLYDARLWGPWRRCGKAAVKPADAGHRFAQWCVVLRTRNAAVTPKVTGVTLTAKVDVPKAGWWGRASITDAHNETVRFTSTGFEYERVDHTELKRLRRKYKLDTVVAAARDELEAMRLLRDWVAHEFCWAPPGQPYPTWDAHDILSRKDNMCVQSAIALMHCAMALGMQARFTFGIFPNATLAGKRSGGHEVTEIWSNQFGKWVYMDATSTRNECYVDRKTGLPQSMLEMHDETVRLYNPQKPISLVRNVARAEKTTTRLKAWKGKAKRPSSKPATIRYRWGTVHWMPRNNFFARRRPVPIAQGRIGWSWPGYLIWWDEKTPRPPRYGNYTCRRSDIEWTINQVRYAATAAATPGKVDIRMSTVTPDFETFLVRIDGGPWKEVGSRTTWQLEPGSNRIEMCVRTTGGAVGNTSWLEVDCTP